MRQLKNKDRLCIIAAIAWKTSSFCNDHFTDFEWHAYTLGVLVIVCSVKNCYEHVKVEPHRATLKLPPRQTNRISGEVEIHSHQGAITWTFPEEDLKRLSQKLHERSMCLILDIVLNHVRRQTTVMHMPWWVAKIEEPPSHAHSAFTTTIG